MTKKNEVYLCPVCGGMMEVLNAGAVPVCCGKPMTILRENDSDGAYEKHVPVVDIVDGCIRVRVGASDHPMTDAHYIGWIELLWPGYVLRKELHPGDNPEAIFTLEKDNDVSISCLVKGVVARAYCNLHGLWKSGKIENTGCCATEKD